MSEQVTELNWCSGQIWRGCTLAAIVHAMMVAHYPELSNEHSWDGMNYSVQDSTGARGTITFSPNYVVAAFRKDNSERLSANKFDEAIEYFSGAPIEVIDLAKSETLLYLLEDINGDIKPQITTSFWGTPIKSYSLDSIEELYDNGASLLEYQLMHFEEALEAWKEYYDMSNQQCELLLSIYNRKVTSPLAPIHLTKAEIKKIGDADQEGLSESKISFNEIGIKLEM
ncbi:hypothetical protein [Paenibacillus terrigena]|uniref:hypothetical protein n=1 Tax=Paenibacillus terrigena TaxID=369333 RepID=UPI0003742834|nr:hypothetical protein [Paenibacillus terrigena]